MIISYTNIILVPDNWASVQTTVPHQNPLHGYNYTITCTVYIIEGMNIPPVIQWYHSNGSVVESGQRITITGAPQTISRVKTVSLTFSPILSDDGDEYFCRAQVAIPWMAEQPRVHSARANLVVTSMFCTNVVSKKPDLMHLLFPYKHKQRFS